MNPKQSAWLVPEAYSRLFKLQMHLLPDHYSASVAFVENKFVYLLKFLTITI